MIKYFIENFPFQQKTPGSSGFDLYATEDVGIVPGGRALVKTGLYLEMPPGVEAQVRSRSGLVRDHGIAPILGTVDSDYRGEIAVTLFNLDINGKVYEVKRGDRIGQLVFCPIYPQAAFLNLPYDVEVTQVDSLNKLSKTLRDKGGFGSTGR